MALIRAVADGACDGSGHHEDHQHGRSARDHPGHHRGPTANGPGAHAVGHEREKEAQTGDRHQTGQEQQDIDNVDPRRLSFAQVVTHPH